MNRLFIHHPLFRLFSPVFSGSIVYLLILLVNNNVEQLEDQFLGEELYICIGLSFIIQEFSRLLLILFKRLYSEKVSFLGLSIQVLSSMLICILTVTYSIKWYFEYVLGFSPSSEELWLFNSIFCTITLIYILLHISHQYLYKLNEDNLDKELVRKQSIEEDFNQYKEGINAELLFDSFEALIVLIRTKSEQVDELIDHLASLYRYTLSGKERQLVSIEEEMNILTHLVDLLCFLPNQKVVIQNTIQSDFFTVPTSILKVVEYIVRTSIRASQIPTEIVFSENGDSLEISYKTNDVVSKAFNVHDIEDMHRVYSIYSKSKIKVVEDEIFRKVTLPKLTIQS